jgi:hypothetical protein
MLGTSVFVRAVGGLPYRMAQRLILCRSGVDSALLEIFNEGTISANTDHDPDRSTPARSIC